MTPDFWQGKRVLLTGHTGFKGSWLKLWLLELGAEVTGLSLPMETDPALHDLLFPNDLPDQEICDIRDAVAVTNRILKARPEIVFHLAAQPLVRASYRDPAETWAVNVQGTVNVLEALRAVPDVKSIVVITTDKVYENNESGRAFVETDPLGGHDPYSASKAAAEIVVSSHRLSFFAARKVGLATARAGNVIGGGDWAEDRMIPDAIRAWTSNKALTVRNPASVRPWQHVLEPLAGYLSLAEQLWFDGSKAGGWNFGPDYRSAASVSDVLKIAQRYYGTGTLDLNSQEIGPHEAGYLMLDSRKARTHLGFEPKWNLETTLGKTMDWYREMYSGQSARSLCLADIDAYSGAVSSQVKTAL